MDLAAAIREGATRRPKVGGALFHTLLDGRLGSCALGAAYEALTGEALMSYSLCPDPAIQQAYASAGAALRAAFPELSERTVCPVRACRLHAGPNDWTLNFIVSHLNDAAGHGWTREQIADWLDTR